jgi:hypothetical protein
VIRGVFFFYQRIMINEKDFNYSLQMRK